VPNDVLRKALASAEMSERDLASRVKVDPKTVARWLSDESRTPHARHRWAVAEILGVNEAMLWPEAVRAALKVGADREVVAAYPYRSSLPRAVWAELAGRAERDIMLAGYTGYFLWSEVPRLRDALRTKAAAGARVRFLLGDPDAAATRRREEVENAPLTVSTRIRTTLAELEKLRGAEGIEARLTDADKHLHLSVFRFDNDAIVCQHLADLLGHDSPTWHLRRRQADGLFDRFVAHSEHLWEDARPVWASTGGP
jgi:transcriptional regulator with XRE-family HTH domain